jgi:hypothetical protein
MEIAWFVMTVCLFTPPCLPKHLWPRTKYLWSPNPLTPSFLNLAPSSFFIKMKLKLKGFNDILEIQQDLQEVLNGSEKK